ncbi:MAG: hypothetical protein B7Y39_11875 [Bdellovibrio sp. 28-41-41]|nr:MAG: hypothetical protein B7Y39_11875 [Bdellovibrio sp. 28-41-41]
MEDGSSQSFLGSLIKTLSSALSEQHDSEAHNNTTTSRNVQRTILDSAAEDVADDLDWESPIEDQDMVDSMNIHKRILDSEIDTIDKELDTILKNKETVDYLVSLVKKRERLETQVHQLEDNIGDLQKEG